MSTFSDEDVDDQHMRLQVPLIRGGDVKRQSAREFSLPSDSFQRLSEFKCLKRGDSILLEKSLCCTVYIAVEPYLLHYSLPLLRVLKARSTFLFRLAP